MKIHPRAHVTVEFTEVEAVHLRTFLGTFSKSAVAAQVPYEPTADAIVNTVVALVRALDDAGIRE